MRATLRALTASALVASASACTWLTAPGSPPVSAFEDASKWSPATLLSRTKNQCNFLLTEVRT